MTRWIGAVAMFLPWGGCMAALSLAAVYFLLTEYEFMEDLLELDRKWKFPVPPIPTELLSNPSPLQAEAWRHSLLEQG